MAFLPATPDPRCDQCRYWKRAGHLVGLLADDAISVLTEGECRKGAPVRPDKNNGRWPLTLAEDFCGEFRPAAEPDVVIET